MKNKDLKVLIVEDEIFAAKYLEGLLRSLGFENIFKASNAQDALDIRERHTLDLVFMDINIQGPTDGIECSKILNQHSFTPIIFTTAYGDSQTIQEASNSNFYGYLVKPFEMHDLEASLRVALKLLRQSSKELTIQKRDKHLIELGEKQVFNLSTNTLLINNKAISLTHKETLLLASLSRNLNQNISYDTLKEEVWYNANISNSTIRDTIARLKKKAPRLHLENITNYGYILKC